MESRVTVIDKWRVPSSLGNNNNIKKNNASLFHSCGCCRMSCFIAMAWSVLEVLYPSFMWIGTQCLVYSHGKSGSRLQLWLSCNSAKSCESQTFRNGSFSTSVMSVVSLWVPVLVTSTAIDLRTLLKSFTVQFCIGSYAEAQAARKSCWGEYLICVHIYPVFCFQRFKSNMKCKSESPPSKPEQSGEGWKQRGLNGGSSTTGVCHSLVQGFCQSSKHGPTALLLLPLPCTVQGPGRAAAWGKCSCSIAIGAIVFMFPLSLMWWSLYFVLVFCALAMSIFFLSFPHCGMLSQEEAYLIFKNLSFGTIVKIRWKWITLIYI